MIENKKNYPFSTKVLIDLFNKGDLTNVKDVIIEPDYGWVGRIKYNDGRVHIFKSTNFGVNNLGASEIAKDKGYSKFFLNKLGYKTPKGKVFLMPSYLNYISPNLLRNGFKKDIRQAEQSFEYAEQILGYPCYAKPNLGLQGNGVMRCEEPKNLEKAISGFLEAGEKMFLLEEAVNMPDFRVVVFREDIISCYQRIPLEVIGDGKSNIRKLLINKQDSYLKAGRKEVINIKDEGMIARLEHHGLSLGNVLEDGKRLPLLAVSNLSKGGESKEFTGRIHERWRQLSVGITKDMGLKLCGVDIACNDIEDPDSDYSIFEINASPGLDNYASTGEDQLIRVKELYRKIFNNQ